MMFLALLFSALLFAQEPQVFPPEQPRETRLPNGRTQRDAIIKADHEKNLEDARSLVRLAESLKTELEKQGEFVLSVGVIKKTEDIEKTARRIRSRMKRL